ncbi:hypothetical protein N431DRAFT_444200 [Stipitochalara longipes BDJ]|nr:hypothetical protein N431DRAFT_444200 [Stipitochalara longipes BDJ]
MGDCSTLQSTHGAHPKYLAGPLLSRATSAQITVHPRPVLYQKYISLREPYSAQHSTAEPLESRERKLRFQDLLVQLKSAQIRRGHADSPCQPTAFLRPSFVLPLLVQWCSHWVEPFPTPAFPTDIDVNWLGADLDTDKFESASSHWAYQREHKEGLTSHVQYSVNVDTILTLLESEDSAA